MDTFVEALFSVIIRLGAAVITVLFFARYMRELWYFFTDRAKYDTLHKSNLRWGEDADGPVIGTAGRLLLAYPMFIIPGGLMTYDTAIKVISYINR